MTARTPQQIQRWLDENLHRYDLPSQYLGDEPNTAQKPWDIADLRCLLAASWPYEQAAGNQSVPCVYKQINEFSESFLCDRWYLPSTRRDLGMFERDGLPIFGIETKHQAADFDIVATSIAYPVLMINFIKYLSMSDIPVRRRDRAEDPGAHPFILVGGQAYGAPEALASVVDCWFLGEVEDEPDNPGLGAVLTRIQAMKRSGHWRAERMACYAALAREFNWLYFPEFVDVEYGYEDRGLEHPSKVVTGFRSTLPGMRMPFIKRYVKDLNAVPPLNNPPLLYLDPDMGSGDLEVGRGCPAWCSFCALTYRQKPYRQRSVPYTVNYAKTMVRNMGATRVMPYSPDFPMHTERKRLVKELLENVTDEVDSGAMRVDDFIDDSDYILLHTYAGMDDVTLGVEGNSQRMRDLVGKGTADEDIKEAVSRAILGGIKKIKMFMITGLPGEDAGDVERILRLARDLADIRDNLGQPNVRIQFSWTPLLVEANTPLQWFAPTVSDRALGEVWEEFRDLKIAFKLGAKNEPNRMAVFQLCQRANRESGDALVDVILDYNAGCWGGVPRTTKDDLDAAMKARGFHNGLADAFDERGRTDLFGWEFIDQGINPDLLWTTYLQMREFIEHTDSASYDTKLTDAYRGNEWIQRCDERCLGKGCGVCDATDLKIRRDYIVAADREVVRSDLASIIPVDQRTVAMKIRARFVKDVSKRFVLNDHWRFALRRACYHAEESLGLDWGIAKRTVRFASEGAKYKFWVTGADYVEFGLTKKQPAAIVQTYLDAVNTYLEGIQITDWRTHPVEAPTMRSDVDAALYALEIAGNLTKVKTKVAAWHAADYVKMIIHQVDAGYFAPDRIEVNAKDYVDHLWLAKNGAAVDLRMMLRGSPSPYDIYAALMGVTNSIAAKEFPARRIDAFLDVDGDQYDFFRPSCLSCDTVIPVTVLDTPYHADYCPPCLDIKEGRKL